MLLISGAMVSAGLAGIVGASPLYTAEGTSAYGPFSPDVLFVMLAIVLIARSGSRTAVKWVVAAGLAGTVVVVAFNGPNNSGYLLGNSSGYLLGTAMMFVLAAALALIIETRNRASLRSRIPLLD